MPFVNERLAANQEINAREKYQREAQRTSRYTFEVAEVMGTLKKRIIGQAKTLAAMEDMLYSLKADFGVKTRPLSVSLFLGPTGVGKTETVRVIAEALQGSADKICRIDMNTLAQEHYSAAITGSPPGYVGSKEGTTLFDAERIKGSFSQPGIVLFDEIEKANKDVVRALLNLLDTGKLMLTAGSKELDFTNCLIFMTSNIGVKEVTATINRHQKGWRRWFKQKPDHKNALIDQALHAHFDPEFINRIDRIIAFDSLASHQLDDLVTIELDKLNHRLRRKNAQLQLDSSARQWLTQHYDARFGARDIARHMRVALEPKLAKALLTHPEQQHFIGQMRALDPSTPSQLCILPAP